jgi:hypothetical protein
MKTKLRRILFLSSLIAVLMMFPGTALAQGSAWQASYWNNTTLTGTPVLQRSESNLDYNWGMGSPDPAVKSNGFSARWTRYLDLTAGTYRFTATSDDGIRVYVDGSLIINEWYDHPPKTISADRTLSAGTHLVVVEFYENGGEAVARLSWKPVVVMGFRPVGLEPLTWQPGCIVSP